jgi:hypothetical protein
MVGNLGTVMRHDTPAAKSSYLSHQIGVNFAASRGRMKVSAFGFAASRLSQGDQRGHDTGGFKSSRRRRISIRTARPLKADLGRVKAAREGLAKKPAIRDGRKSREVAV